jgi:hypothetical protein
VKTEFAQRLRNAAVYANHASMQDLMREAAAHIDSLECAALKPGAAQAQVCGECARVLHCPKCGKRTGATP